MAEGARSRSSRSSRSLRALLGAIAFGVIASVPAVGSAAVKAAKAPPAPELPSAKVMLEVTPASGNAPWRLRVTNKDEVPVRIAADARLLVLDLEPPATAATEPVAKQTKAKAKAPGPIRCILPSDARPSSDQGKDLVLPPSRSWSATFDPLFYCFGARERAALVPGTTVRASFGWPAAPTAKGVKPQSAPFGATPVGAGVGKVGALKAVVADPVTLAEAVAEPQAASEATKDDVGAMRLSVPATLDAARGVDLSTTVTLKNEGDRSAVVLFRPSLLQLSVVGPHGTTACGEPRIVAAPIRELFATLPARGSAQAAVLVTALCPAGTFDEAGIYRVTPRLDTTNASGRALGLATWDGVAVGKAPLAIRVRSPRRVDLTRPTAD